MQTSHQLSGDEYGNVPSALYTPHLLPASRQRPCCHAQLCKSEALTLRSRAGVPVKAVALAASLASFGALFLILGACAITGKLHTVEKGSAGQLARNAKPLREETRAVLTRPRLARPVTRRSRSRSSARCCLSQARGVTNVLLLPVTQLAMAGAYYTRIAYHAWRGTPGFSYAEIPDVE